MQLICSNLQGGPELENELDQVTELLAKILFIQRMTQIRTEIEQRQRKHLVDRFEKGKINENNDLPTSRYSGSSLNDPRLRINVIRVIKIEIEDVLKKRR